MNEGIVVYSKKGDIIFTTTGEIKVVDKKKQRHTRNIIHQVFENLKEYNTDNDTDMDYFLSNASRNVFQKHYKFINSILYKRVFKSKYDLYINTNELEKTYKTLKEFIKIDDKRDEVTKIVSKPVTEPSLLLNDDELMYDYILRLKEKWKLSNSELVELESLIKMGILSEFINDMNIIIDDNKIEKINYVHFDTKTRKFYIDEKTIPKILKKDIKKTNQNDTCSKKISKFLSHVSKNYVK